MKGRFICEVVVSHGKAKAEFLLIKEKGAPLLGKGTAMKLGVLKVGVDIATVTVTKPTLQQKYPEVFSGVRKLKTGQGTHHIDPIVRPVAQPNRLENQSR